MSDLDFEEQETRTKRPDVQIMGGGLIILTGMKGQQQKHISQLSGPSQDAFAEAYAIAAFKYAQDNGFNKTKDQIKTAFKNLTIE